MEQLPITQDKKIGVLFVNVGTPNSFAAKDVWNYLIEFLTDKRVIDKPFLMRQALVRGLIVPLRFRTSSASYKKIWTKDGSPLMSNSIAFKKAMQNALGQNYHVELAMRYQNPSLSQSLLTLKTLDVKKIIILPLFPQYASATVGSVIEEVMNQVKNWNTIPHLEFISSFYNFTPYIKAVADTARSYDYTQYDHFLFSFHGIPLSQIQKQECGTIRCTTKDCCKKSAETHTFCYAAQCYETAAKIIASLALDQDKCSVTFQSRLGKSVWLEPYTSATLKRLANEGSKRILVFCPSFVADCLETIYEIGHEYKEEFIKLGGERLDLVQSLNAHPSWITACKELIESRIRN